MLTFIAHAYAARDTRSTVYISSMITQGERTPAFTANAEYQVTGVNYDQGPNRITTTGEKSLASRGTQMRNDYGKHSALLKDFDI